MKYAIGKLQISKDEEGKLKTPRISRFVPSQSKEDEERIGKMLKSEGFQVGKPFKNPETKQVLIPGTFWVNDKALNGNEINEGVMESLKGKFVFFDNGYVKNAKKAYYKAGESTVFNVQNVKGKDFVRIAGNLKVVEKEGKKSYFISNSVKLVTKDGKEWGEKTIKDQQEKLKAFGLHTSVNEHKDIKYLNITKSVYPAKTSIFSDEKLVKKVQKDSPFVVLETSLPKHLEGGTLVIDKNNRITPLGDAAKKTFKGYEDKMTMIQSSEKEDLYASNDNSSEENEEVDSEPGF